ncbi:hypothetical protein BT69DRAFT_1323895 [Atractiella rhizophila]|nr:hypothetical protein BT69DRAFT_1323895 [Atractiella rhizophila]
MSTAFRCAACQKAGTACLRAHVKPSCDRCMALDIPCESSHRVQLKMKNSKRWDIDELQNRAGYTSSNQLLRDITQLDEGDRKRTKKKASHLRVLQRNGFQELTIRSETKKLGSIYPQDWISDSIYQSQNVGHKSVSFKLGAFQLQSSLGNHLIKLALTPDFLVNLKKVTGLDFPTGWASFNILKENKAGLGEFSELWITLLLSMGTSESWHSGILGRAALSEQPRQSLNNELGDYRTCGEARSGARWALAIKTLSLAVSVLQTPSQQSLSITNAILGIFNNFRSTDLTLSLLELGVGHFRKLLSQIEDRQDRRQFIDKFFVPLYVADGKLHSEGPGLPKFTDHDLRSFLRSVDPSAEIYIDPEYFFRIQSSDQPSVLGDCESYWKFLICMRRHFAIVRERFTAKTFNQFKTSASMAENAISQLVNLMARYRTMREQNFRPSPPSPRSGTSIPPYYVGPGGEEALNITKVLQVEESTVLFLTWGLAIELCERFPTNLRLQELCATLQQAGDVQIKLSLELWTFVVDLYQVLEPSQSIFQSPIRGYMILIRSFRLLPKSWKYLVHWERKFPQHSSILQRTIAIWKHLSFSAFERTTNIQEYEEEHERIEVADRFSAFLPSTDATLCLGSSERVNPTPPSPTIADFSLTLGSISHSKQTY